VVTESLQIDKNGPAKYLYAFTYGRGAWRVNLTPGAAECSYTVSPQSFAAAANSGTLYSVNVDTAPGCAWSASAVQSLPYVRLQSPAGGVGPGTLYFMVAANFSGAERSLPISVQDQTINISQPTLNTSVGAFDQLTGANVVSSLPYYRALGFNILTSSPSDPVHSCTGSADLSTGWFGLETPTSQRIDVTGSASAVATVLTAYTVAGNGLGPEIGCVTNLSNIAAAPSLQFDMAAGTRYVVEIGGVGQALGTIGRVTMTFQTLPVVTIEGGPTQFTALVTGTPNTAVRWTAQYGQIDAGGNYTPPAGLLPGQSLTDTITATSFADPNAFASVTVTVAR